MINNKTIWEKIGQRYNDTWSSLAKKKMSERELSIINHYLKRINPDKILDIGVGTGRILSNLVKNAPSNSKIYGLDISKKMITLCKNKFQNYGTVKSLKTWDITKDPLPFSGKFDLITAIRVLKYCPNWKKIISSLYKNISKRGLFIFTMPNYNSINRFVKHQVPVARSTVKELKTILKRFGFEIVEIKSITKIPDFFYNCRFSNNFFYVKILIFFESLLESILGKTFLGRILFITVTKNDTPKR